MMQLPTFTQNSPFLDSLDNQERLKRKGKFRYFCQLWRLITDKLQAHVKIILYF